MVRFRCKALLFFIIFVLWVPSFAQSPGLPDAPSATLDGSTDPTSTFCIAGLPECPIEAILPAVAVVPEHRATNWEAVGRESLEFLSVQHGVRLFQSKTRAELGGPFWRDYVKSIEGIHGWGDGDSIVTNYIMHPGMGSVASFIYIQNSPKQRTLEFDAHSGEYWRSRLKGLAFAAAYSTQFEIGLYSEATIGNVGLQPGTSGYTDFVMTPVGGFAISVAEDAVDAGLARGEQHWGPARTRVFRSLLNPTRSIANLLRHKAPWYRDNRKMPRSADEQLRSGMKETHELSPQPSSQDESR